MSEVIVTMADRQARGIDAMQRFWDDALDRLEQYLKAASQVWSPAESKGDVQMLDNQAVSRAEWLKARRDFLVREKEFTRLRDQLSAERRALPWVRVDKTYRFSTERGEKTLVDLFDSRSQLIVYHFMFGPTWDQGCKSCSFWADGFNDLIIHLNHRNVSMVAVSRAPLERLLAFQKRMGWTFFWASSHGSDFNFDYRVSFTPEELAEGSVDYNFGRYNYGEEAPGVSVFYRGEDGQLYHTYSCYGRGLDILNAAYSYLDLVPKGRDEGGLDYTMAWVRHHDRYERGEPT